MDPASHPTHNFVFKGPEPGIGDLGVYRGTDSLGRPLSTSHWKPTDLELQALIAGGAVRLTIFGDGHPPVSLGVEQP